MQGAFIAVTLQHQDTGSFCEFRILLNWNCHVDASKNIRQKYIIGSKFSKAVDRYADFTAIHQFPN